MYIVQKKCLVKYLTQGFLRFLPLTSVSDGELESEELSEAMVVEVLVFRKVPLRALDGSWRMGVRCVRSRPLTALPLTSVVSEKAARSVHYDEKKSRTKSRSWITLYGMFSEQADKTVHL